MTPTGDQMSVNSRQDDVFSFEIEKLPSDPGVRKFCRAIGVKHLGEACLVDWEHTRMSSRNIDGMRKLLRRHGLDFGIDPIERGWVPPYWNDDSWRRSLDLDVRRPKGQLRAVLEMRFGNVKNIGVLIVMNPRTPRDLKILQAIFGQRNFSVLRAGMLVPPDWRPSKPIPIMVRQEREQFPKTERPVAFFSLAYCREIVWGTFHFLGFSNAGRCPESSFEGLAGAIQQVGIERVIEIFKDITMRIPGAATTDGILGRGDKDITNLAISEKTIAWLRANGMRRVCDLLRKKPEDLAALPGYEEVMLEEIVHAFSLHGLMLGTDIRISMF